MSTYFHESRTIHASVKLFGPYFSTTSTRSILGSATGIGVDVDSSSGIVIESSAQDLIMRAAGGGAITVGGATNGAIAVDAGGNAITIGNASADTVTIGGGGGSTTITGSTTIEGNTVTLGGNGTTTVLIGSNAADSVTIGAATNTLQFDTHLTTASSVNVGSDAARFGTVYASTIDATTVTATSLSFQNQVLGWSTTLLQDESGTEVITGSPMACKVFELDLEDLWSPNNYFHTSGSTNWYPLKFTDPRTAGTARERHGFISAHAQVYQMFVTLVTPMTGALAAATWNIVHAPKATALVSPLTVTNTANDATYLQLLVSSTASLTVGDELLLSGFTHSAWNVIGRIKALGTSPTSITMDILHASGTASGGTATVKSQLTAFSTDIVGASAVSVALADKRFDDTGMDDSVAGSTAMVSGAMPVPNMADSADDHYIAMKITSTSQAVAGKMRVFVMNVSFGATK